MFEIDDEERRARVLLSLGGVEEHVYFEVAGEKAYARPEQEVERTTADGKTSAVHFCTLISQISHRRTLQNRTLEPSSDATTPITLTWRFCLTPQGTSW